MRKLILRSARPALVVFGGFLVGLVGLADSGHGRWLFAVVRFIPGGDKTGHFLLFGILAFLANLVLRAAFFRCGRFAVLKGSLLVSVLVIAEEFSQRLFVARTFDWFDMGADLFGIWCFGQLARLYIKLRPTDQNA